MKYFFVACAVVIVLGSSCSSSKKLTTIKPAKTMNAAELVTKPLPSFINIPVTIQIKDIETLTNNLLDKIIYEDTNYEDDDLKMTVWKEAPIKISYENGKIKTICPLRVKALYRIGTNKLGFNLYDEREFNLSGTVTLLSDIGLNHWNLKTNTTLKSLVWKEHATMNFLGQNVPVTSLIMPAVVLFQEDIVKSLDGALSKSMNFKPQVMAVLETVCKPFQMSETYESWLRIVPEELYTTDATLKKQGISFTMGMKCRMETLIGAEPKSKFNADKIILKPVKDIPNKVSMSIATISSYEDASRLMNKNFKGQEFGSGSKKVQVQDVEIWQNSQKLVIGLALTGAVNGKIYLTGYPQYNNVTQEVYLDQLEYVLDTKSVITKTANWLVSKTIMLQLQQSCRYSIKPNVDEGTATIKSYLDNYVVMPGVFVNGQLGTIKFQNIQLTNEAIVAFIDIEGTVSLLVKGLE